MALDDLNATIWAQELLRNQQKAEVYAFLANRDYEGDIRQKGDTVKIHAIGPVAIGNYTKDTDISWQTLDAAELALVIDQAKYFAFEIDDVDRIQNSPDAMSEALVEASYAMRDTADQFVAALYTDANPTNNLGTTGSPKVDPLATGKAYEYLVDLGTNLTTSNCPTDGRFVVIPPWYLGGLLKDARFVGNGTPFNADILENGKVGRAAGFDIYVSNNVPLASTKYRIIAGHPSAWAFAEQLDKVETLRRENRFADGVKGLHLYGAKVLRPDNLAVLTATATAS